MTQPDIKYGLEIPYDRTVDELLAIVKQPAPICWTGYIALAHKKSDESIQALSSLLDNQDWTHQRAAIEAIGNHIYGLQLEIKLLALLNHPNNFIVSASIKALTNLQSANSHDRIKSFISSDNMELQKYAIEGISKIWEGSDYKFLLDLYINLTNEDVRKTIGFVLVDHTNKSNWKTFFDTFSIDKVSRHREWALTIGNEFASDKNIIKQFLNDPDGHVRNKAKRLADMGCA